jgi:N-acetylneuraminic acid mutarotase
MTHSSALPFLAAVLLLIFLPGCEEASGPKRQDYPFIQTNEVTEVDGTGVTFNGELLQPGVDDIVEYGFVWAMNSTPTMDDRRISVGKEMPETFSTRVKTDLIAGENYVVRAYAITKKYVVYGNEVGFTSLGSSAPVVTSVIPDRGIDGDTIVIVGENFGSTTSTNAVTLGELEMIVIQASNDTIKAVIPEAPKGGAYQLKLSTNGKSTIASGEFILENPKINSVSPSRGPDGALVTIEGSFSAMAKYNKVTLNQDPCFVFESSRTQLKVWTPYTSFVGNAKFVVDVNGKQGISLDDFFVEGPYITSVSPLQGKFGDVVSITGEGFSTNASENIVSFGSLKATVTQATATELKVMVPGLPEGMFTVSVKRGEKTHSYPEPFSASNAWKEAAVQFPGEERGMATGFSIGNKGFITLGRISSYSLFQTSTNHAMYTDLWEFNSESEQWIRRQDFPGEPRYFAVSFSIGTKGYVGWGVAMYGELLTDFYEYDSETNSWRKIADVPGTGRYGAVAFSVNGKGYIGLGQGIYAGGTPYKSDFFEYDPATDKWKQFNGPGAASAYDFAFSLNNKGYVVIGGNEVWELDPNTLTWTKKSDYPDEPVRGAFSFVMGEKAYAGSGLTKGSSIDLQYSGNFYEYDPVSDTWTQLDGFEYLKRFTGVAWGLGNKGYVVTGQSNAPRGDSWPFRYVRDFWVFEKP